MSFNYTQESFKVMKLPGSALMAFEVVRGQKRPNFFLPKMLFEMSWTNLYFISEV